MFRRLICWLKWHEYKQIIDNEERRAFQKCQRCGREFQYDFQVSVPKDWIGFATGCNQCPLCMGWRSRTASMCGGEKCLLNPCGVPAVSAPRGKAWTNCAKCGEHLMYGLVKEPSIGVCGPCELGFCVECFREHLMEAHSRK